MVESKKLRFENKINEKCLIVSASLNFDIEMCLQSVFEILIVAANN